MSYRTKIFWLLFYLLILVMPVFGQVSRTITFQAKESTISFTEPYLYTDQAEVSIGARYLRYKPAHGRAVVGKVYGKGKKYTNGLSADQGGGADIIRTVSSNKIKETVIINDSSISKYQYVLNTNMRLTLQGTIILLDSTLGYIAPPVAWDADSNVVSVSFTLSNDTLTYTWSKPDSVTSLIYPLYIDPTFVFNSNDMLDAMLYQPTPTTVQNGNSLILKGDSVNTNMSHPWIWVDLDSVPKDSIVTAKLILTTYQANFGGAVDGQVHLVKVGKPVETELTWNQWKTGSNWNSAGGTGGADIEYSSPAPVSFTTVDAAGAGVRDTIDVTTLIRKVAGKDSSYAWYGLFLRSTERSTAVAYYASSEHATASYRPTLVITTFKQGNVYRADSLHFSAISDTTVKLLNIALPSDNDSTSNNKYSIRYVSNGYWIQPPDSADNPFNKNEQKYSYATLKNITFPLVNNYNHVFEVRSWAANSVDSLKSLSDTLLLGTVFESDTVVVHDTTEVYYYIHDTVTIVIDTMFVLQSAAVYDLISDSIGLARLEWRSNISDSLATVQPESLAYANLTGLDSAEFYVMGYDSTTGGTVLRKLKELLSYIGL